jgi:hypothetical protein
MSDTADTDLRQRLELIERVLAEGRRGIEYYGSIFVLWGLGHLIALGWQHFLPYGDWAWGITMSVCAVLATALGFHINRRQRVHTKLGQVISGIWWAFGGAITVAFIFDRQHPLETFFLLIGMANVTSGLGLRWATQIAVGLLWWAAAGFSLALHSQEVQQLAFAVMAVVGEVGFGLYLMAAERRDRAASAEVPAGA